MKTNIKEGSITVFLSLLLPLILALIGTLLEGARIKSLNNLLSVGTKQEMQMMFSDYNRELWEDYHLLAYSGDDKEALDEIERGINDFISTKQDTALPLDTLRLWHTKLTGLSFESKEMMTDEDGEILKHEATEYMKYQVVPNFISSFSDNAAVLKQTGDAAVVAKEKMAAEEKLYEYSEKMLDFMELIDGIDFGKEGVQYKGNLLKTKDVFVRQFFYGDVDKSTFHFENDLIWDSLKNSYFNAKTVLEAMEKILNSLEDAYEIIENGEKRLEEIDETVSSLQSENNMLSSSISEMEQGEGETTEKEDNENTTKEENEKEKNIKEEKSGEENSEDTEDGSQDEIKERISENNSKIQDLENERKNIQEEIKKAEKTKKDAIKSWKTENDSLKKKAKSINQCVEEALKLIPELKQAQKTAAEAVSQYQTVLKQKEGEMSEEMYTSFLEDSEELASSVGLKTEGTTQKQICDLNLFQSYLKENEQILNSMEKGMSLEEEGSAEYISGKIKELKNLKLQAKQYHSTEFVFSYQMIKKKTEQENPADALKKLGNQTLLSLVVKDENKLSQTDISTEETVFSKKGNEKGCLVPGGEIAEFSVESNNLFSGMFGDFSSCISESLLGTDSLTEASTAIVQELILNCYVQEVFFNAVTEEENTKDSLLTYEQEYILSGQDIDKDNLAAVVKKISAIRMVCNYISLLSDKGRQEEAYAAATLIAGFTGLEPLVKVIQSVILLVWAYEEGLVDIAALLQGKKVEVIKASSGLALEFQDLFAISRSLIQKKAKERKEGGAGCNYSQYLYFFLCMQKQKTTIYRMADVIQMNMKKRYAETFLLGEAVFGCKIKADYYVSSMFFKLPLVTQLTQTSLNGWEIKIEKEKAY